MSAAGSGGARRAQRANRIARTAIVAGIVAASLAVADRWFVRWDLTEHGQYSLAPATRRVLAALDDEVVLTAYFSRRLPPYLMHQRRQVQDLLEEYGAHARGRLALEFVDPADDPETGRRMRAMGIPQLQLEVVERDQLQLSTAYLALALQYGGRQEVIPVIQDTASLEYELTAALVRLVNPEKKGVGWIGGGPEPFDPGRRGADPLRRELGRLFDLDDLGAGDGLTAVPEGVDALVLAGPRDLPEPARFAVDQFIMRGGSAVFLVDHIDIPPGSLAAVPVESGIHDLLEHYGVKVARDVVFEPRLNAPAAFSTGYVQFRVAYPYWALVPAEGLDREHPVTSRLERVVLPWASTVEYVAPAGGAPAAAVVLARTSPQALAESGGWDFEPQPRRRGGPAGGGPAPEKPLALLLTGRFRSFWADREPPAAPEEAAAGARRTVLRESPETSILVVGTSRLAEPEFLRQFPENGVFLLNAVDWMTMGQDLIGIRSRISSDRVLSPVSDGVKAFARGVNVVGVPLLVALAGFVHLARRRRRRAN